MIRKLSLVTVLLLLCTSRAASALEPSSIHLLNSAWPDAPAAKVSEIGRGIGVVFSPDLSVPGNCRFYEALGFACFQDADWNRVLDGVHQHNVLYPERRIFTLVLETHGTNGNGLKLQTSYAPTADRSYISVGALQERAEPEGIYYVIISACNSGRLLRPYIRDELDPYNGDRLFLPATCGLLNASPDFDSSRSPVTIIAPESSHIETTLVGAIRELAPQTRRVIAASARALRFVPPTQFAISDMMMQILIRDPRLQLVVGEPVDVLSPEVAPVDRSEELFRFFVTYLKAVAHEQAASKVAQQAKSARRPSGR